MKYKELRQLLKTVQLEVDRLTEIKEAAEEVANRVWEYDARTLQAVAAMENLHKAVMK